VTRAARAADRAARALLLLALCCNAARANPADAFGLGSRAAALQGAATALADDSSAVYYNPAGLSRARDLRIDLGYQGAQPLLTLNGKDVGVDATHGFTAGLVAPGTLFGKHFAFGAALFLPDDRISRTRALPFAQPRFAYYDNRTQRIFLGAALAIEIVRGLHVGAGLAFMARTAGTVELQGTISPTDPDNASALVTAINVDLIAVRYPHAGIAWEVNRWLTLGVSYRHSFLLQLDQGFTISGTVGDANKTPIINQGTFAARTVSTDLFQPWQLTAGAAVRLTRRVLISYDLAFVRWSDFQTPASAATVSFDLGATFNPLIHVPPPRSFPSPGFHDIFIPRLGIEWRAVDGALGDRVSLDLRAGYRYEPSPAPEQTGESNYADCDKHGVSVGAGLVLQRLTAILPRPLAIDAHLGVTVLAPRANHKIDPTDPVGDYVAAGAVVEGGVTTRWSF
jgi:long-chain fatty acid transport protein